MELSRDNVYSFSVIRHTWNRKINFLALSNGIDCLMLCGVANLKTVGGASINARYYAPFVPL